MIKNIKKYILDSEKEREMFLKKMTYRQSSKILESIMSSKILLEMHFVDDDNPISLSRQKKRQ